MASSFAQILESESFVFVVGEGEIPMTVHSKVIAPQSSAFEVLINGNMREAQAKRAALPDVEKETFVMFCQFAYTGDYLIPSSEDLTRCIVPALQGKASGLTPLREEQLIPGELSFLDNTDSSFWEKGLPHPENGRSRARKKQTKREKLWEDFKTRCYESSQVTHTPVETCLKEAFLEHARLYAFAEKWSVESLKIVVLRKLHRMLCREVSAFKEDGVVELLRYTYSDESTPSLSGGVDLLRNLVAHYIACNVEELMQNKKFVALLEGGGDLVMDLMRTVLVRMD